MGERMGRLKMEDVRSLGESFEVGQLRTLFFEKVEGIVTFEIDGVVMCLDKQVDRAFRGSIFHEMIIGILSEREIPSRGMMTD